MFDATAIGLALCRSPAVVGTLLAVDVIAAQFAPWPLVQHGASWMLAPLAGVLLASQAGRTGLILRGWFQHAWKFHIEFTPIRPDPDDPPAAT